MADTTQDLDGVSSISPRDNAKSLLGMYFDNVARLGSDKLKNVINVINKYKGETAREVAHWLGYTALHRPDKLKNIINAINKYEEGVAWEVARSLGNTVRYKPNKLKDVVDVIGKYKGGVAKMVAFSLGEALLHERHNLKKVIDVFITHGNVINKYEGDIAKQVAYLLGNTARQRPDKLKNIINVINKYEGDIAKQVAQLLSKTAHYKPNKLEDAINAFTIGENVINKHERDVAKEVAYWLDNTAHFEPKKLKHVINVFTASENVINKYQGNTAKQIANWLGDAAYYKSYELEDIINALKSLENPEYQKRLLNASDAFFKFNITYLFTDDGSVIEANEKANEILFKQGNELISKIKNGEIALNPDLNIIYRNELQRIKQEIKIYKQRLEDSHGKDKEAKEELRNIQSRIKNDKKRTSKEKKNSLKENYTLYELKGVLDQLSQHYLTDKYARKAKQISKEIIVSEGKLNADTIEMSVWKKSFNDLPTYEEYHCCAFDGLDELINYMLNPAIQLLNLGVGDKKAMAITASTTSSDNKKVLLLDSFESNSHLFARKQVSDIALAGLKKYALNSGFDELFISSEAGNNAPQEFYENIDGNIAYLKLKLDNNTIEPYLETNLHRARGKLFKLR